MLAEQVTIRPYEPADRAQFLSLYETVWGRKKDADWFRWRFEDNSYRDGVEMVVAEDDGDLVGVEPLLPCRLRVGDTTVGAFQPVDWLVHPDYRRQGLFSRMTDVLLRRYAGNAALLFNFPNEALLPGLEKHGWQDVGAVPSRYRVHHPRRMITREDDVDASPGVAVISTIYEATVPRLQRLLDRTASRPQDVSVTCVDGVPVADVAERYHANLPERIHVARDEAYLRWRFANPRWETTTYLAWEDDAPAASVVAATERRPSSTCTYLLDVQPMTNAAERAGAFRALLADLVADHSHVDLLRAPAGVHAAVFRRFSFWHDTAGPLSPVTTTSRLAVRPLAPQAVGRAREDAPPAEPWRIGERDVADPENWLLMPVDLDIE